MGRSRPAPAPASHVNLPADAFPFTVEAYNPSTGEVVWHEVVEGPRKVCIPPLKQKLGYAVNIRVSYANGRVDDGPPKG